MFYNISLDRLKGNAVGKFDFLNCVRFQNKTIQRRKKYDKIALRIEQLSEICRIFASEKRKVTPKNVRL